MKERINWEEYALLLAKTASLRSEDPYRKVGACALSTDNRVLGIAYNGLQSNKKAPNDFWNHRDERRPYVVHAETNLLSLFKRNECRLIAVTLLPCEGCARQIVAWNIPKVIYIEEYNSNLSIYTKNIFDFYNIEYKKIVV
jgi:dCMP deaminase